MIEKSPSCDDVVEPELLPVQTARERLFEALERPGIAESITLDNAFGRVLAADVVSPMNVPAQTNSAMDGYAIANESIPSRGEARLQLKGKAWACLLYTSPSPRD